MPNISRSVFTSVRDLEFRQQYWHNINEMKTIYQEILKNASLFRRSSITNQLNSVPVLLKILKILKPLMTRVIKNVLTDLWSKFLHNLNK